MTAIVAYEALPGMTLPAAAVIARALYTEGHRVAVVEVSRLPADGLPELVVLPATAQPPALARGVGRRVFVYGVRPAQLMHLPNRALAVTERRLRAAGHRLAAPPRMFAALDLGGSLAPEEETAAATWAAGVAAAHRARPVEERETVPAQPATTISPVVSPLSRLRAMTIR